MRRANPQKMLVLAAILLLSGAAAAANKNLETSINGQATDRIDTNYTANVTFTYSNPAYWNSGKNRYMQVRLYLSPNNATAYTSPSSLKINYSTLASACRIYTPYGQWVANPLCYRYRTSSWPYCNTLPPDENVSVVLCQTYVPQSTGVPYNLSITLPGTMPLTTEDLENAWTGRDYTSSYVNMGQAPANEYWGNTTTATPAINVTNASAPSKQKVNLGQEFTYNITARNENNASHTGKAYGVFLYALTNGVSIRQATPQKADIDSNATQTYTVTFNATTPLTSFWIGAKDNGTSARGAFNSTLLIGTINVTDQLLVGVREPSNQSYGGETYLNLTVNVTDANGLPLAGAIAYANITGIENNIPLYYSGGLYRGNYTIATDQPTPWTIVYYSNDTFGNSGTNTTQFYDVVAPRVANLTAQNVTDRQNATINASIWDALGVAEAKAQIRWTTTGTTRNYTLANYSREGYYALIPPNETVPGINTVTILTRDTSGNWNNTATATFRVNDTTPPALENVTIVETGENASPFMNASAWDITNVSTVWVQVNSSANHTLNRQSGNTYNLTFPLLAAGAYNLTIFARDTSGNTNSTARTMRINDTTPPAITVMQPESGAQTRYGQTQNITANVTDNYAGVDRVWAVVDSNQSKTYGLAYTNGLYSYSINESPGQHNLQIYANDTRNNTRNASASFTVFVEAIISDLAPSLPSPQNAGTNITWTTTVENAYGTIYYQYNISQDGGATWRTGRDWNESNAFTWRTNASDSGLSIVRVYASNSTARIGNRTSAAYNISTRYRIEADALQYGAYMRGENITFTARVLDARDSPVTNAQASSTLTEGQTTLNYNGTHYTGSLLLPANATDGNWTANISASDAYNSGSLLLSFNVSSRYTLQTSEPYENDSYLRGDSANLNLTITNARGELLRNLSGVSAYLQKGSSRKQAVGLTYTGDTYKLYFPFAFNSTDGEGAWEVFANASQYGNSGNASTNILLNATLALSASPAPTEVYNPIRLNFTIDRQNTTRRKENTSLGSDAYFQLNNTESLAQSGAPMIGSTPFTYEYSYDTENNGTSVNRTGSWTLRINISNNRNYGETYATIPVVDTQNPIAKKIEIGDNYRGAYFENSAGAQAYPNDTVLLRAEFLDNLNTSEINLTITRPGGANTTVQMQKYWSKNCKLGLSQQDCDDTAGSAFRGAIYQVSRWSANFSQTGEPGNYTITRADARDSSGNANTTAPGYSFEVVQIRIGLTMSAEETNVSEPVSITADISGNLTSMDYVRINISGREGSTEYALDTNTSYTSTRSDWHYITVTAKSANYQAENSTRFWVNYGTAALTTKLEDNQTQLNGTYKTVNMSITAVGGDLGNVRIGSNTTNASLLIPDFSEDAMAVIGDINNSQTAVIPFGFTANGTGTVNITMIIRADQARTTEASFSYLNYELVAQDAQQPQIIYANTTTAAGYANINESVKIYARITDNVDVANANLSINCTDPAYDRAGEQMAEEAINTEFVWAYQFTFTGQPANCTFTINAMDTSNLTATPLGTVLSASTRYALTAAKTGAEPLLRGEELNVTVSIITENANAIEGANVTYNITRPDNTTYAWAGSYSSSYAVLPSDPDGTYTLRIDASKYGNSGNATTTFRTNSTLALDPQYTQEVRRGGQLVLNTSVKNARGQNYDAAVNLTFLNQTSQPAKTLLRYSYAQQVPLATAAGNTSINLTAYKDNNTFAASLPLSILPASLNVYNLRTANTIGQDFAIGKGDNITVTLEVFSQDFEHIEAANVTATASSGETINFTAAGGGTYSATMIVNISQNGTWQINATASYLDNNPGSATHTITPINKKWKDADGDSQQEFAEDPAWVERYDNYRDATQYQGAYSTEFYHFPLSPHNGFMIITSLSYYPDVFWSPYDDINTSISRLDISQAQGNGIGNPYEYYVDTNGDGNFEKQYANGQLNTISGKKLAYNNATHLYAFDLQNIGRYDTVYDILGDTNIFCGGARYTVLGYLLGNSEQSEYILGKSSSSIPNWYWDANTNSNYTIFNDAADSYYVEADGTNGKTGGDLLISTSNGSCSFSIAACGNGVCQAQYGETTVTCPADCQNTQNPGGSPGGTGPSSATSQAQTQSRANATENTQQTEGLDVIIQSPTNLLVTQGNNLTFQITLASTSKDYQLQIYFRADCCNYSYHPDGLLLGKGTSEDVSINLATTLTTRTGEYPAEFRITYKNYTKTRTTQIKVEENAALYELSQLKQTTLLLKENLRQLNQSSPETESASAEYSAILAAIADAENAVEENNPAKLASIVQQTKAKQEGLSEAVKVLMKKQGIMEQRAATTAEPGTAMTTLLFAILIAASATSVIFKEQIKQRVLRKPPEKELKERISELKEEEARIVQMKKSTEREYFSRKLDQKTFIHIMSEYESKQIDIKARIAEAQQKLGELTKPKEKSQTVEMPQEGKEIIREAKKAGAALEKGDYQRALEAYQSALDAYSRISAELPPEVQNFIYGELNQQYSSLEGYRSTTKKANELYSALRNCKNCISDEKYDLAKHFFEQARTLHNDISRSEIYGKNKQHEEIERLYKETSDFHKLGE